jgi:hypothetical protein
MVTPLATTGAHRASWFKYASAAFLLMQSPLSSFFKLIIIPPLAVSYHKREYAGQLSAAYAGI